MPVLLFFFFNDTATTEIYTLSLHDALPISLALFDACSLAAQIAEVIQARLVNATARDDFDLVDVRRVVGEEDRKSTRLNSSHQIISYAVFCLKKKKTIMYSGTRDCGPMARI